MLSGAYERGLTMLYVPIVTAGDTAWAGVATGGSTRQAGPGSSAHPRTCGYGRAGTQARGASR